MTRRHRAWLGTWVHIAIDSGVRVQREKLLREVIEGVGLNDSRRIDMYIESSEHFDGRPLLCDVTITDPIQANSRPRGASYSMHT